MKDCLPFDTLHEECGVFGIFGSREIPPAQAAYYGLYALQHRGQESCGIAVSDQGVLSAHRAMGLVGEVFDDAVLSSLPGQIAIGHVRYSTAGGSLVQNCQPLLMRYAKGRLAIAHNGNLTNAEAVREELAKGGAIFQTTIDSEVIAHVIAQERIAAGSIEQAVARMMNRIQGAYSLLVMSPQKLVAARDPFGFRPLVIGQRGSSFVIASETCALDAVDADFVRDVEPGEVVVVDAGGLRSIRAHCVEQPRRMCVFEYLYFARPDSTLDGVRVHAARLRAGALLAREHPADADIVIGVPDSGLDAAIGFSQASGIPFETGFVRNNYVGRTFIKPEQGEREASINIKLNVLRQTVAGKRIVMVDDSIVRGSTSANIIRALKKAGAKEVHVRISSPTL
uniref:amidophosphoribosyltransferase n=1 Tax=Candidatus Fimivicinus sp. TaxID=3056640 RepID=UPI003FF074D6